LTTEAMAKEARVRAEVRPSPKQADRLEQCYRLLHIEKSAITEAALEEFFASGQEEVWRVRSKRR